MAAATTAVTAAAAAASTAAAAALALQEGVEVAMVQGRGGDEQDLEKAEEQGYEVHSRSTSGRARGKARARGSRPRFWVG